jgi:hypothetical protein
LPGDPEWRLALYLELAALLNRFFAAYPGPYCLHCGRVLERMPEARSEAFELVDGVYPGCCHRGAGDIFRLEGQPRGRERLAPEMIAGLQRERARVLPRLAADAGGSYTIRRRSDQSLVTGAHCRYFTSRGCGLGVLKGPLCLNFICPPLRCDLLTVCGGNLELVGPENDFLFIYRTLAAISWDDEEQAMVQFSAFRQRLDALSCCCRDFLAARKRATLYDFFMPAG